MNGAETGRPRDAAATRAAILHAAEELFAARGYPGTTLQEIGAAAGFSRGTPGYLFGSKRALYAAVVDRMLARADAFLLPFTADGGTSGGDHAAVVAELVARYFEFLVAEPNFVRLVQFESGDHAHEATGRILAIFSDQLVRAGVDRTDAPHVAIAIATLCSPPSLQAAAVASALDIDLRRPSALELYKAFVTRLLLVGLAPGEGPPRIAAADA